MGRALDVLRENVLKIKANPNLILDEYFMMKFFDQFLYLTSFADYLEFMFTKRRMSVIARRSREYEYWWCQGKVIEKVIEAPPTVQVLWNAMSDLD